ncbi:erythromycin esterase family protein [Solitalea lacus]|uniref:erythromycin esterase family protein n=1 Tax=Solitalea lacus TaxID=2911172 RepID=UPI001EDBF7C9|nr:erythromycin esterase family protein [Solitalea lacus]UKJ08502.1 erythromycin esterase family protein [Solitalea lacus]
MMNFISKYIKITLFFALAYMLPFSLLAQDELVTAINNKLIPVNTLSPSDDFSDLEQLKNIFKDKKIVGLGEATHATKEFFDYKHRLLRFMVTELGFKTFIIEADFAGSKVMNDYVLYGKGDPYTGLKKMGIGVWMMTEFLEMVEWIKEYNSTKALEDKVKFYGCDMQVGLFAAQAIKEGLGSKIELLSDDSKKGLDMIINWRYHVSTGAENSLLKNTISELNRYFPAKADTNQLELFKQYIRVLEQNIEFIHAKDWFQQDKVRDKYMAENCKWIYQFESKGKAIIWAHNGHVSKDITMNNNLPMGNYLAKVFPQEYYVMGFGFNSGKLGGFKQKDGTWIRVTYSIPDVQIKNSSDYVFKQCDKPNFILDFNTASTNPIIADFLNKKVNSRLIGGVYHANKQAKGGDGAYQALIKMYDAIIFIRETNASTALKMSHFLN